MIFAEIFTDQHYNKFYSEVDSVIRSNFESVESGLQSDGWIWVLRDKEKVAIDTFSSMLFEVKCVDPRSKLLASVLNCLKENFELNVFDKPEYENHEHQYT